MWVGVFVRQLLELRDARRSGIPEWVSECHWHLGRMLMFRKVNGEW